MPSTMYLAHLAPEQIKRNAECEALLVQRIHEQLQGKDYPPERLSEWAKVLDGIKRSNLGLERNNIAGERLERMSRPRSRFGSQFSSRWNPDLACIRPGSAVVSAPENSKPPDITVPRVEDPPGLTDPPADAKPSDQHSVTQSAAPAVTQSPPPGVYHAPQNSTTNTPSSVQAIARTASNPVPPTVSDEDFRLPLNWDRRRSLIAAAREIYGLDLSSWLTDPNLQPAPRHHRDVLPEGFAPESRRAADVPAAIDSARISTTLDTS